MKILFCSHYFSPLKTFIRKGKDPEPDPGPYLKLQIRMRIREALKHTSPSDQDSHFMPSIRISNTGKKAEGPGEESLLV
jgi:hypothetical protein